MPVFRSGAAEAAFDPPAHFPTIIETAEAWEPFGTFRRQLASRFQVSEFGAEKLPDGSFIIFPLEKKDPLKPKKLEFESFLQSHIVLSAFSPKSAELLQIIETKKKYADSHEFLKHTRISMMRLVSQMIVLRKELLKQEDVADAERAVHSNFRDGRRGKSISKGDPEGSHRLPRSAGPDRVGSAKGLRGHTGTNSCPPKKNKQGTQLEPLLSGLRRRKNSLR